VELRDRVAVVTGADGAVGAAVARRFAAEGARVVPAREHEDAPALIDDAAARLGPIDILVNAAGMAEEPPWEEPGPAAWERRLRALTACARCCEAAATVMRVRGRGRIVNVAASAGRYRSAYARPGGVAGTGAAGAAAGGGVLSLTRELALELGPHGIGVNAVVPGWIATERSAREWERMSERARRDILAEISLGRPGQPAEVAGVVLFLASEASSYVSGCAIDVNGGWWMS
jgi:NAD(P)-dependent dehydrogenase (short-subunit alcohol dehydrogenase family)